MTTDNRTNEQIVAEAVDSIHLSDWDDAQALCVKNVTAAVIAGLDTAGRLVNEPTEAQIEAALGAGR